VSVCATGGIDDPDLLKRSQRPQHQGGASTMYFAIVSFCINPAFGFRRK
jgi:hypothetical protein